MMSGDPHELLAMLRELPGAQRKSAHVSREVASAFLASLQAAPVQAKVAPPRPAAVETLQNHVNERPRIEIAPATSVAAEHSPAREAALSQTGDSSGATAKSHAIENLRSLVLPCTKCVHLAKSRTQVVFGVGNPDAELMFVGEAPGADEDAQGEPFVGRAGQLLTKIIEAMAYSRSDVFIANVLKCRPNMPEGESGNRRPTADEMATCLPYLQEQIRIIRPKVVVALGAVALEGLLGSTAAVSKMRGRWQSLQIPEGEKLPALDVPLMPTYHSAYLLTNQLLPEKRKVWEDMLLVLEKLERPISEKQRNFFLKK
jgi:DNA polymerase